MNQTPRMNKELSDRVNSGEHEFVTGESDNTAYICAECGVAAHEHRGVGWMAPEDRNSDRAALAGAPADASDAGLRAALQGMVSTFGSNHPLNPSIDYEDARRAHEEAAVSIAQKALAATPATTTEETK